MKKHNLFRLNYKSDSQATVQDQATEGASPSLEQLAYCITMKHSAPQRSRQGHDPETASIAAGYLSRPHLLQNMPAKWMVQGLPFDSHEARD